MVAPYANRVSPEARHWNSRRWYFGGNRALKALIIRSGRHAQSQPSLSPSLLLCGDPRCILIRAFLDQEPEPLFGHRLSFTALLAFFLVLVHAYSAATVQKQIVPLNSGWEFHQLLSGPVGAGRHALGQRRLAMASRGRSRHACISICLRNKLIPDPFYRDNEAKLQWIENADWEYRTTVQATPALLAQKNIDLVFEGLDAYSKVYLNDKLVLTADNMFREWRVSVKADLKPGANTLRVVFPSPIKAAAEIAANDPWQPSARTSKPRPTFARPPTNTDGTGARASSPAASGVPRGSKPGTRRASPTSTFASSTSAAPSRICSPRSKSPRRKPATRPSRWTTA